MALDYAKVENLDKVLEVLKAAHDYEVAVGTNANLMLAGDGVKAVCMGTRSTEPTLTKQMLMEGGLSDPAATAVLAEFARLRAYFLAQA